MKIGKLSTKLKNSIRKHYVRKKDFEALAKEVNRLTKKLAKLEKCCDPSEQEEPQIKTKQKKKEQKSVEAVPAQNVEALQDKLTAIKGIGPVLEKKLLGLGITRFSQIAGWSEEDVEMISEHLSFKGRIQREEWIEQAADLVS